MRSPGAAGGSVGLGLASIALLQPRGAERPSAFCDASAAAAAGTSGSPKPQSTPHVPGTQWHQLSLHRPRPLHRCTQYCFSSGALAAPGPISQLDPYHPGKQWQSLPKAGPRYMPGVHGIALVRRPRPEQCFIRLLSAPSARSVAASFRLSSVSSASLSCRSCRPGLYAWRSHRPSP